jgi:hypothetical protein
MGILRALSGKPPKIPKREMAEIRRRADERNARHGAVDADGEAHYIRGLEAYVRCKTAPGTTIEWMDPEPFETSVAVASLDAAHYGAYGTSWRTRYGRRGYLGNPAQVMLGVLHYEQGDLEEARWQWHRSLGGFPLASVLVDLAEWVQRTKDGSDEEATRAQNSLRELVTLHVAMECARFRIHADPWTEEQTRAIRLEGVPDFLREKREAEMDARNEKQFMEEHLRLAKRCQRFCLIGHHLGDDLRDFERYSEQVGDDVREADTALFEASRH